jgi:hypothetical protein
MSQQPDHRRTTPADRSNETPHHALLEQRARTATGPGQIVTGVPTCESFLAMLAERPAFVAVPLLALLAFVLRFRGYDRLSLWQDEGWTTSFARLPLHPHQLHCIALEIPMYGRL